MTTIADLRDLRRRARTYAARRDVAGQIEVASRRLRAQLPFATRVLYAYHPRQGALSGGRNHLSPDAAIEIGRLRRPADQPLCSPRRFWGLETVNENADCLGCLAVAERIIQAGLHG